MISKISCKETFSGLLSKFIFVSSPDGELEFWQIILDLGVNNKKIKLLNNVKLVYIHSQQTMFWNGNSSLNQNNKNRLKCQAGLCLKSNVQSNYIYKCGIFNSVGDFQRSLHMTHRPYRPPLSENQREYLVHNQFRFKFRENL